MSRARAGLSTRLARAFHTELWGLGDQGLVSGVNFFTLVLLARTLEPVEFGYFVLAFTILQTATTLQSALITRAHNVFGAVRTGREYADYSTTALAAQACFAGALALLALAAAGICAAGGFGGVDLLLVLAPALVTWQFQELGRRILYTEGRFSAAFAADAVGFGAQVAALVLLWRSDRLTATTALAAVAASALRSKRPRSESRSCHASSAIAGTNVAATAASAVVAVKWSKRQSRTSAATWAP